MRNRRILTTANHFINCSSINVTVPAVSPVARHDHACARDAHGRVGQVCRRVRDSVRVDPRVTSTPSKPCSYHRTPAAQLYMVSILFSIRLSHSLRLNLSLMFASFFLLSARRCVAVSWNGPKSEFKDLACNFKCAAPIAAVVRDAGA
jgi:hypothetical protein